MFVLITRISCFYLLVRLRNMSLLLAVMMSFDVAVASDIG
jgi:hypothetical protein